MCSTQPGLLYTHPFILPYLFVVPPPICHLSTIIYWFAILLVVVQRFSKALFSLNAKPGRNQLPGSLRSRLGGSGSVAGESPWVPFFHAPSLVLTQAPRLATAQHTFSPPTALSLAAAKEWSLIGGDLPILLKPHQDLSASTHLSWFLKCRHKV